MKITHIITSLNDGGAQSVLYRICRTDRENSHNVISMMPPGKYSESLQKIGIKVESLNMPQGKITLRGIILLWKKIKSNSPDAIQTWMYHADLIGGLVAKACGIKAICWGVRHSNLNPGTVKSTTIVTAKACAVLSKAIPRKIIFCSQQATHTHIQIGYCTKKIKVIPNGYNLDEIRPKKSSRSSLRNEWGALGDTPVLGMVARFDKQKDHENLISALQEVKNRGADFICVLAGPGVDNKNQSLVTSIKAKGLDDHIILLGRRNDIPELMSSIDIHVLSSLGEAFPNVLAEAMACGTPCVTTDVGDASLILGSTGWIVPPKDTKSLAQAIIDALKELNDVEKWRSRQKATRAHIENNFTLEKMIKSYSKVWHDAYHEK